jgi:hypothetical protein
MKKCHFYYEKSLIGLTPGLQGFLEKWMHNRFVVVLADARLESQHIVAKEKENLIKEIKVNTAS